MTVVANCTMCFKTRRDCRCAAACIRPPNRDPIHADFAFVEEYIADIRFFGHKNAEYARAEIATVRQTALAATANGTRQDFKKIDEDAERLEARIKGKLFGTVQRMVDRPPLARMTSDECLAAVLGKVR